MAPISTETEEMTRVIPRHFGPPLPEVSSVFPSLSLSLLSSLSLSLALFVYGFKKMELGASYC